MTVKEVYEYFLKHQVKTMAHCFFHLVQENKISLQDEFSPDDFDKVNKAKVKEMIDNNILGIYEINVYGLKMNEQDYVYIFARNSIEAIQFFIESISMSANTA
ncbi:hypothetical protein IMZ08_14200 [Bacillus luteolus]|uniref:Uncharacterized protein n=1 Tax=Litchfieldia luteola TaxID=682179 RepID=A0ABR9QL43_9BACI|nr:hypothetical protein [Cytobacillus luteolus]MBE4909214.1 hypothetical protein [Cytobacillus luteolus]MBP1940331.1 hypothetical protein [Cytobacillus luteolus]